jgi:hypothetical protein
LTRYSASMSFRLTPHAAARIGERGIPQVWLDEVLDRPHAVVALAFGREERQGRFERDGKPVLLRVICEGDLIITAILTSKLDKYGRSR